ncbi:hypothetical protein P154DRAFT_345130 [Amniculicola lignicola CBS 123094]|uniref:Uncharacterized protein n=1 Tax=Amniculicola lignicola CBS 123094 TaxID=1392246 RepID=A0A6A5W0F2_9PLEO|nr:hypothetical protein P154DRAFT_345130 [Amniculicola lignicola CBS 123094]
MMKFLGDESVNEDQHATPVALDAEPEFTPDQISEIESLNAEPVKPLELAAEPQLTADQISDIESRIGAGLIEEVIQVAEGELGLAMTMIESKVWEELEEKAPEGQWSYFERS